MYYRNKIESLQKIFGTKDLDVSENVLRVGSKMYPIRSDVIDLTDSNTGSRPDFAEDIQYSFGAEWKAHSGVLPEHAQEFRQYFDLVDLNSLREAKVCDLGCGSGRWSTFLADRCKELILVDFSEAIYVARENLKATDRALFFKADILRLPFADNFADFLFSLGVLHHLPVPCLDVVKSLKRFSPRLLIFLYYALDNRPAYFRVALKAVTLLRIVLARVRSPLFRNAFSYAGSLLIYMPLIVLGSLLRPFGLSRFIPLYEFYHDKSLKRVTQDVYDRFFTRIEQRVSRAQIMGLKGEFREVTVSEKIPYWHFLLAR